MSGVMPGTCPYCGAKGKVQKASNQWPSFRVVDGNDQCRINPSTKWYYTIREAVEVWNRRAEGETNET